MAGCTMSEGVRDPHQLCRRVRAGRVVRRVGELRGTDVVGKAAGVVEQLLDADAGTPDHQAVHQ